MKQFKADRGFMTFAIGEQYLRLAYAQALSIKNVMPDAKYAVVIDETSGYLPSDRYDSVFDSVIHVANYGTNPMTLEWMAYGLSPWKETIKLDADVYFPESIDHWWSILRQCDVWFPTQVYDYTGKVITSRWHRKLFDDNNLPDVYTALYYFRYSQLATTLFTNAKLITADWDWFASDFLINNRNPELRTDEVFALAALITGVETCTVPGATVPSFVHMKEQLIGLEDTNTPWPEQLYSTGTKHLDIHFYPQTKPVHFYRKEWMTDDRIEQLERIRQSIITGNS